MRLSSYFSKRKTRACMQSHSEWKHEMRKRKDLDESCEEFLMRNSSDEHQDDRDADEPDDDDDDSDVEYGLRQALPVAEDDLTRKDDDTFSYPPTTGEEYLLWVRREAKRYPKICVSQHPALQSKRRRIPQKVSHLGGTPTFLKSSKTLSEVDMSNLKRPHQDWTGMMLKDFQRIRDYLEVLKLIHDRSPQEDSPLIQCVPRQVTDEKVWYTWCYSHENGPFMSSILSLDQEHLWRLLEFHMKWLQLKRFTDTQVFHSYLIT